ncbi:MAG: hypothetical protein LBL51_00665 [Synergistaceae bacterium]|jgi:hypothetical protein|nr:hypothetical protein [Synergistaceae bacterium]
MKTIKSFLKGVLFLLGVAAAACFFAPWKQLGESAAILASRRLRAPSSLSWSAVKNVPGGFALVNLSASRLGGVADISCETLTVEPDLAASVLNMAPTCRLTFAGLLLDGVAVTPSKKYPGAFIGNGRVTVSVGRRGILLEGLRSGGDLSLDGDLMIDFAAERPIVWADLAMNVKYEPFEKETLPPLQNILPLRQEAQGRWRLRRTPARSEELL